MQGSWNLNHGSEFWGIRRRVGNRPEFPFQIKIFQSFCILRSGDSYDSLNDRARMGEETIRQYFCQFCKDPRELYGGCFLNCRSAHEELDMLEKKYVRKRFPGCGGFVDCMKIVWKS